MQISFQKSDFRRIFTIYPQLRCSLMVMVNHFHSSISTVSIRPKTIMASTGVLPFVRGIDFSNYDFKVSLFDNSLHCSILRNLTQSPSYWNCFKEFPCVLSIKQDRMCNICFLLLSTEWEFSRKY